MGLDNLARGCHRHALPVHSRIHPHVDAATGHGRDVREATGNVRVLLTR